MPALLLALIFAAPHAFAAGLAPLDAENQKTAAAEMRDLRESGDKDSIRRMLKSLDPKVRYRCAYAVGKLEAAEFADDMAALLRDKEALVRKEAAFYLAVLMIPGYGKQMTRALKDSVPLVRASAVYYLQKLGTPMQKEAAKALASDPDANVRDAVATAFPPPKDQAPAAQSPALPTKAECDTMAIYGEELWPQRREGALSRGAQFGEWNLTDGKGRSIFLYDEQKGLLDGPQGRKVVLTGCENAKGDMMVVYLISPVP